MLSNRLENECHEVNGCSMDPSGSLIPWNPTLNRSYMVLKNQELWMQFNVVSVNLIPFSSILPSHYVITHYLRSFYNTYPHPPRLYTAVLLIDFFLQTCFFPCLLHQNFEKYKIISYIFAHYHFVDHFSFGIYLHLYQSIPTYLETGIWENLWWCPNVLTPTCQGPLKHSVTAYLEPIIWVCLNKVKEHITYKIFVVI